MKKKNEHKIISAWPDRADEKDGEEKIKGQKICKRRQ